MEQQKSFAMQDCYIYMNALGIGSNTIIMQMGWLVAQSTNVSLKSVRRNN